MAQHTKLICFHILFTFCLADTDVTPPPLPPGPPPPEAIQDEFIPEFELESDLPIPPPEKSYSDHLASYQVLLNRKTSKGNYFDPQEILDKINWLNSTELEEIQLREGDWTAAFDAEENGWYFFNKYDG